MVQLKLQNKNGSELEMLTCQGLGGSKIAANRDVKAKNTARKEIATVVEDLRERELIQLTTRGNIMYTKIKLTLHGEGMVTTCSMDGDNR